MACNYGPRVSLAEKVCGTPWPKMPPSRVRSAKGEADDLPQEVRTFFFVTFRSPKTTVFDMCYLWSKHVYKISFRVQGGHRKSP